MTVLLIKSIRILLEPSHMPRVCSHEFTFRTLPFSAPCIVIHICEKEPTRRTHFFITKPTRCTNFTNLFCRETLHVSDSSSVHHQQFIHCSLSNGICHTEITQMSKNYWCIYVYMYICEQCS